MEAIVGAQFRFGGRQNKSSPPSSSSSMRLPSFLPLLRSMTSTNSGAVPVTTLIFDVDDTLYDVGTGFTAHRNGEGAQSFMVEKLHFASKEQAKVVRDEYFERYHATAKALAVAQKEGRLPESAPEFRTEDLAEWWATRCDYSMLGGPKTEMITTCQPFGGRSGGPKQPPRYPQIAPKGSTREPQNASKTIFGYKTLIFSKCEYF